MPRHQITQHFPLSTYALLTTLNVAPCGIILRVYMCTAIDSVHDVGNDQSLQEKSHFATKILVAKSIFLVVDVKFATKNFGS